MHSEPEFAEERSKSEAIRFVVIGTLIGALVVVSSKTWLFSWIREFATSAPCRKVWGIEGLTVLWYGLFVGMPGSASFLVMATFGWRGYKTLRDGRFPPAKEKVFKPTRIRRGTKAMFIGYLHLAACLPFLALAIWGSFQAEDMIRTTQRKIGACVAITPK